MRRRSPLLLMAATLTVTVAAGPATAQVVDLPEVGEPVILDIVATIVDLDGGTSTVESVDETAIVLEGDVFFDFDEAELLSEAEDVLADVAEQIAAAGVTQLDIGGHTDSVGTDAYNQDLSERRAEAVEAFLADRLDGVSFTTEGFAAREPVAANETEDGEDFPEGRALNRRVEIRYRND